MGICISKCCFHPTTHNNDMNLPQSQDKHVVSQHNNHPTKPQTSSSSPSYSTSSSSSYFKLKPYTNEFLLACAKKNPHIVSLDPPKDGAAPKRRARNDQPMKQNPIKLASKREWSGSPQRPTATAKSLRRDRIMMADKYRSERMCSFDGGMKHKHGNGAKSKGKVRSLSPCKRVMEDIDNPLISMECFIFL